LSKREIASLACKILGIYIFIQGINILSSVFSVPFTTANQIGYEVINFIFPLVYIIAGAFLWILSDKLSAIMVRGESNVTESLGLGANEIQRISFSVLGLYFLGNSLPKLVSTLSSIYVMKMGGTSVSTLRLILGAGGAVAEIIVGLGIFLGSRGLVNFLKTIRTVGLKREDDHEENE